MVDWQEHIPVNKLEEIEMLLVERVCWVTRNKEYKEYLIKRKY
jgi:hypothetical protein